MDIGHDATKLLFLKSYKSFDITCDNCDMIHDRMQFRFPQRYIVYVYVLNIKAHFIHARPQYSEICLFKSVTHFDEK